MGTPEGAATRIAHRPGPIGLWDRGGGESAEYTRRPGPLSRSGGPLGYGRLLRAVSGLSPPVGDAGAVPGIEEGKNQRVIVEVTGEVCELPEEEVRAAHCSAVYSELASSSGHNDSCGSTASARPAAPAPSHLEVNVVPYPTRYRSSVHLALLPCSVHK